MLSQIHTQQELLSRVRSWRIEGLKIVFTNGCFDIIHLGHIDYLTHAAAQGNRLIVGLNSDRSVKLLNKGSTRPIQDERSRLVVVAALRMVDAVVLFEGQTPEALIKKITPDVLVKGGDWNEDEIAGAAYVRAHGGIVKILPYVLGYSTTAIEKRIRDGGN